MWLPALPLRTWLTTRPVPTMPTGTLTAIVRTDARIPTAAHAITPIIAARCTRFFAGILPPAAAIDDAGVAGEKLNPAVTDLALGRHPSRLDRPPRPLS
jgi:hypothetical protein